MRLAFDMAERNGKFGRMECQKSKESSSRGKIKSKRRVFFCRRTVRVEIKGKVISTSFLKIEERGTLVGVRERRKKDC